jgi:hypothetical protein
MRDDKTTLERLGTRVATLTNRVGAHEPDAGDPRSARRTPRGRSRAMSRRLSADP